MRGFIGIRKEDKDPTEKRAPLTPPQVKGLIRDHYLKVVVEPSAQRIFKDEEYQQVGAILSDDLSNCNIIFGVKEIPTENLLPQQVYCFFSHTIKGQSYNMPMLKRILDLRNTLIDYEKVTDRQDQRIIFFGNYAGYAGMINSLWALGSRLKWEGLDTPFYIMTQAAQYDSLNHAKMKVREVGETIKRHGLPEEITPLICGFTGYGQVSQGAQEIFDLLPQETVEPHKLLEFMEKGQFSHHLVYKVVFKEEDMVSPNVDSHQFNLQDYYHHPENYRSQFEKYIPFLSLIVNGIYWEPKYPRLITKRFLRALFEADSQPALRVIGDITCDIEGSVECTLKSTNTDNPVYVYQPFTESIDDGIQGKGVVVMAVDKLPSELPFEASVSFGESLNPFVPTLATADFTEEFSDLHIPAEFKGAIIAHQGRLTPDFIYLKKFIK